MSVYEEGVNQPVYVKPVEGVTSTHTYELTINQHSYSSTRVYRDHGNNRQTEKSAVTKDTGCTNVGTSAYLHVSRELGT
jgi:hypothetical protein